MCEVELDPRSRIVRANAQRLSESFDRVLMLALLRECQAAGLFEQMTKAPPFDQGLLCRERVDCLRAPTGHQLQEFSLKLSGGFAGEMWENKEPTDKDGEEREDVHGECDSVVANQDENHHRQKESEPSIVDFDFH